MPQSDPPNQKLKASRINSNDFHFKWVIPGILITLSVITMGLVIAALLVIVGVF